DRETAEEIPHVTLDLDYVRPASTHAISTAMRTYNPYSESIDEILEHALDPLAESDHPPRIGVAGVAPDAGVTTLVLSLAHAACSRGQRVLIVDYSREAPALTRISERYESEPLPHAAQKAHVLHRAPGDEGAILVLPIESAPEVEERLNRIAEEFDLTLVDCGSLHQAARLAAHNETIDGVIAVDRATTSFTDIEAAARTAGLTGTLFCAVRTRARGWSKK
ncbi:MAG: hypothetical protein N2444_09685, partial [Methylocystis sp.]|nr:hypothetical protein [Methylocystis sp.]